jgi:hypothetical protein
MPTIFETWSGRRFQRGKTASRVFSATFSDSETINEDLARAALANTLGVQAGSHHPQDIRLLAQEPDVRQEGPRYMEISVSYVRAEIQNQEEPENPLDAPPIISWSISEYDEPTDADVDGNPLTNSAGDVFTGLSKGFYTTTLTLTRNESTFDINHALAFSGAVNSDQFQVPGPSGSTYTVAPLLAICRGIAPASTYTEDSEYVPVAYVIDIRLAATPLESAGDASPWDWRILDQGLNGRFTTSTAANQIGRIINRNGEIVEMPVRFNGDGVPIDNAEAKYRVDQKTLGRFVDQPPPVGAVLERVAGKACFLYFKKHRRVAFAGMGL